MPKASRATASERVELEGYEGRFEHWEGGYSVGFEKYGRRGRLHRCSWGSRRSVPVPPLGLRDQGKVMFSYADGHSKRTRR